MAEMMPCTLWTYFSQQGERDGERELSAWGQKSAEVSNNYSHDLEETEAVTFMQRG